MFLWVKFKKVIFDLLKIKHTYFFLCFAIVNMLFAQDPVSVNLSEKEGLPDVEFYDIIEDSNHIIWLAANKGLYSFNGKEYVGYSSELKRGLSVFGLKMDAKNRLWCNNISGQFFYVDNGKLNLFIDLKEELKGELSEFLIFKGKMIAFTRKAIYIIDLKTKAKKVISADSITDNSVFGSPIISEKRLCFTVNNTICFLEADFKIIKSNLNFSKIETKQHTKFFKHNGFLFLCVYDVFKNKNKIFSVSSNSLTPLLLPQEIVYNKIISFYSHNKKLLLATVKGVFDASLNQNEIKIKDSFFKENIISKAIVDFNKNYWFTTIDNGIYIVPNIDVKSYDLNFSNGKISCVINNYNKIIYGTTKGELVFLNEDKTVKKKIQLIDKIKITALELDTKSNKLYVSTENGSYIYSLQSEKLFSSKYFINAKKLELNKENELLYVSFDRAEMLCFSDNELNNQNRLHKKRAYSSLIDKNDFYVAYVDEFVKYDKESFTSSVITYKNKNITAIDIAKTNNIVWIGTFNKGLIGLKEDDSKFEYTTKNGLLSNLIQIIKEDGDLLWIVTDKGVQVLNTNNLSLHTVTLDKSFSITTIVDVVVLSEYICFINQNQLFEVKKEIEVAKKHVNDVFISKVEVNEEPIVIKENLVFPHYENRINFYFHTNGFYPNSEINYEYRLRGNSDKWIAVDKNVQSVKFNSLPYGEFTFDIRIRDNKKNIKSVSFEIMKPFWKSIWFIFSLFVLLFIALFLFYKHKMQKNEQEKLQALKSAQHQNELIALQLENLKSQMNPHFIFNALNSIQEYIVLNQKNLASTYLSKFANLIRAYLEHSSKGKISLKEEMDCLNIYLELEKLRFEEKLSYSIIIDENIDVYDVKIPTMLIQPYIENALKHGLLHKKDNRKLTVAFDLNKEKNILECTIEDNGVGREKAASLSRSTHKSFASNATEKRLNLLNSKDKNKIGVTITDLYSENNQAIGTRVLVSIPILK